MVRTEAQLGEVLSQFISLLISGPPVLDHEAEVSKFLESPLLAKGVQPNYFDEESSDDPNKKFLMEVFTGSRYDNHLFSRSTHH